MRKEFRGPKGTPKFNFLFYFNHKVATPSPYRGFHGVKVHQNPCYGKSHPWHL